MYCNYSHTPCTCSYSERCIADIIRWQSNPIVSSVRFSCISDSKISSQCIAISSSGKMDIAALIYSFCDTAIFNILYHCTSSLRMLLSNTQVNVVDPPSHTVASSGSLITVVETNLHVRS